MADKPKILVTGASGQLGFKIEKVLGEHYDLVLTDVATMDITNLDQVREVLNREKPYLVIHGAAYTRVDQAEEAEELCTKINVQGTENVAIVCEEVGATLIYISTDYVFDGRKGSPYVETDQPKPLSVYGKTKYEGERAVLEKCPKSYVLRIAWLYGELPPNHPGTNFVETMLRLAKEKEELSIVNDQIGSPTYSGDLVEIIRMIVEGEKGEVEGGIKNPPLSTLHPVPYGIYHFSGAGACSWYDFAAEIFKQTNTPMKLTPITSDQYPQKAKRPAYSYLDKTKIEQALNVKVRPWQTMLTEYLEKREG